MLTESSDLWTDQSTHRPLNPLCTLRPGCFMWSIQSHLHLYHNLYLQAFFSWIGRFPKKNSKFGLMWFLNLRCRKGVEQHEAPAAGLVGPKIKLLFFHLCQEVSFLFQQEYGRTISQLASDRYQFPSYISNSPFYSIFPLHIYFQRDAVVPKH